MKKGLILLLTLTTILAFSACTLEEETVMDEMADEMMGEDIGMPVVGEDMDEMMEEQMGEEWTEEEMSEMEGEMDEHMDDMMKSEAYTDYSEAKFAELKGTAPVALFFHAPWCPTCRAIEADLNKNLKEFPEGTTILKTDYDKESALKKEYGVTSQSTIVFLDASGNESSRLSGAISFTKIKEALAASAQ